MTACRQQRGIAASANHYCIYESETIQENQLGKPHSAVLCSVLDDEARCDERVDLPSDGALQEVDVVVRCFKESMQPY